MSWLINLLGLFQGEREQPQEQEQINPEIQGFLETLQEEQEAASEGFTLLLQIIEFALVAVIVVIVALVLGRAFRKVLRGRDRGTEGQRDSVAQDANPVTDVAKMALRLVPDVLKRPPRKGYRVPDGPPGIVEAFRLYYDLLDTAEEHGITRRKQDTPTEFQGRLEGYVPGRRGALLDRVLQPRHLRGRAGRTFSGPTPAAGAQGSNDHDAQAA